MLVATMAAVPASAGGTLRVAMTAADIPDWGSVPDQGYEGRRFAGYTLYDGLANWDLSKPDVAADIKPGLATGWQINPANNKRWTFNLRPGVKFHDGCEWNADGALWNFERLRNDKAPQYNIRHAGPSASFLINVDTIEKVDDLTIAINTKIPDSLLPYEMSLVLMISRCAVEKANYDYTAALQTPMGTGPYKFSSVVPHERLELIPNTEYWDKERIPKQDKLVLLPMPEASTRAAALLSGQVDFVEAPAPDTIPQLKGAGMQIVTRPYPHNWTYILRHDRPPFSDVRVRQAMNYAMNRKEMVEMLQGLAVPGYQTLTESQPWYGKPVRYEYDPDKARKLLKEAGCMPCKFKVGISTSGSGQMQPLPMNELVKEQLEAVGFEVKLVPMDWSALVGVWRGGGQKSEFDAINFSLGPMDPMQGIVKKWTTRYFTPNGFNWGRYASAEMDSLGDQALATFDIPARDALLTKMNELSVKDAVELYVVHDLNPRAMSPKVKGFVQAQSWFQDLTPISVDP
ncbi:ABC transporter substrate-binding protein [Bradyrhizobium sp. AZCC 2262]|uniref:ABC transporter substrate-binding protein n=1 Tax=Bradyrhizobium sp. AZCC 2262 TaxID=3117022 RepID=UPI002FF35E6B